MCQRLNKACQCEENSKIDVEGADLRPGIWEKMIWREQRIT